MQEKKLGRGLDYLLNLSGKQLQEEKKIEDIPLKDIRKNRFQPREHIEEESLQDLMVSIKENGVLQPVLVKKEGLHFELIAGERRMRACMALGKETIPALVLDVPENKLLQLALIENVQREDLSPIEEAKAYQTMLRLENITHEEMANRIGKNRSTITNALRLLDLPHEIQENVSRGTISQGHARALLSLDSVDQMMNVYKKIVSKHLSVRDVERITKENKKASTKASPENKKSKDANIESYEERLKNRFGTKVDIQVKGNKGTIQIHFFNMDDFSRLYGLLLEDFNISD